MTPELKHTVRKMIRDAIRWQNQQVLFTCRQCCFYASANEETCRPAKCGLDDNKQLVTAKRMPTQLPGCFSFDPLTSAFANVIVLMVHQGIDTVHKKHGWATVVGRLVQRQDKYGYITGVTQKNLERYGQE